MPRMIGNKNKLIAYNDNFGPRPDSCVYLVGLSHKTSKDGKVLDAFCRSTDSGRLLDDIISGCDRSIGIYRTNLVKGAPIDEHGKIRYPTEAEKSAGLKRLKREMLVFRPKIAYLFGKQISEMVINDLHAEKLEDSEYRFGETRLIPAEHPSYIAVYKRRQIDGYSSKITDRINKLAIRQG